MIFLRRKTHPPVGLTPQQTEDIKTKVDSALAEIRQITAELKEKGSQ